MEPNRHSGFLPDELRLPASTTGIPVNGGHWRVITVVTNQPFGELGAVVRLQRVAAWLHGRDKNWPERDSDQGYLVAGAGFEPATFGL